MTPHEIAIWDEAWRAGFILGSAIGVGFGAVAAWYLRRLAQQIRGRRTARHARGDALLAEMAERDLIRRLEAEMAGVYDQDQDRRWWR